MNHARPRSAALHALALLGAAAALAACGAQKMAGPPGSPDGAPPDAGPLPDAGPPGDDAAPPDAGPPPIPDEGPGLEVTSPLPGAELGGDGTTTITVAGRVLDTSRSPRVFVNASSAAVDPATGAFSVEVAPSFGVVHLEVVATDGVSRGESRVEMDVLWAERYEPPPPDATTPSVRFDDGLGLRLGQSFFDDGTGLVTMPPAGEPTVTSDLADVIELVVRHYDIRSQLPDPVVDNATLTLRVTDVRVPEVRSTLDVTDGGLEVFVQIARLEADTEGRLDLAGELLDLGGGLHATVSAYGRLAITKPEGAPLEVTTEELTLVVESAESDFTSPEANAVFRLGEGILRSTLESQLQAALRDTLEAALPAVIRGALEALDTSLAGRSFTIGSPPFPSLTVELDGRLQTLETVYRSHLGAALVTSAGTSAASLWPASRGVALDQAELGQAPFFRSSATQVALRLGLLDGVLHALWSAGLLEIDLASLPPDALGGLRVTGTLSGKLAPVLRGARAGETTDLVLDVGQLELDAEVSGVRTRFGISLQAGVDLDYRDEAFRVDVAETPTIRVWTIEAPHRAGLLSEDVLRGLLTDQLWPRLREAIAGGLALQIPIGQLGAIGTLVPSLMPLRFSLELRDRAATRGGFVMLDVLLRGTLPPPG